MRPTAPHASAPVRALVFLFALLLAFPFLGTSTANAQPRTGIERIAGNGPVEVSSAVARRFFVDTDTVVIARADAYPDALAGAPLAKQFDAPILFVPQSGSLPQMVFAELDRLQPDQALILGGTAAIDPSIEQAIADMGIAVDRIGGATRFHTAELIAERVLQRTGATHAYVVRGAHPSPTGGWPDAVAVSALAAQRGFPILLADQAALNEPTTGLLERAGIESVSVVGGTAVVEDSVLAELTDLGYATDRISGASRFHTSVEVARAGLADNSSMRDLFLVTGGNYTDALATSVAAANAGGTLLLTDGRTWDISPTRALIDEYFGQIEQVTVVGNANDMPVHIDHELYDRNHPKSDFDTSGGVRIGVGQNIQQVIESHPAGTRFVIGAGVHRGQSIVPRTGDVFIGEPGAVLNGAMVLDPATATQTAEGWVFDLPGIHADDLDPTVEMVPGREHEAFPNELWAGWQRLRHVNAVEDVRATGQFHLDYAHDRLIMFDDPRALPVPLELSVTPRAFGAEIGEGTADVVIRNLVVTHYANQPSTGVLDLGDSVNWEVSHVTVLENHALGVETGPGLYLHHSRIVRNGQMGVGGTDKDYNGTHIPVRIEGNEVSFNSELGFNPGWAGGSIKLGNTTGAEILGNWVHNNRGSGPWMDEFGRDTLMAENLVEHNGLNGVMYEISWDGRILDNVIRYNGLLATGDSGAGVWVSNSPDVEVGYNVIEGNRLPLNAQTSPPQEGREPMPVENLFAHDNDMRVDYLVPGLRVTSDATYVYDSGNNVFERNRYRIHQDEPHHFWWGGFYDVAGWQGLGNDVDGQFDDLTDEARSWGERPGFAVRGFGAV